MENVMKLVIQKKNTGWKITCGYIWKHGGVLAFRRCEMIYRLNCSIQRGEQIGIGPLIIKVKVEAKIIDKGTF